jgi:dihydropteroate synthase
MMNTFPAWLDRPESGAPLIMGILNVTPDSFSDGGRFNKPKTALRHAQKMIDEGANIIDVGGESTRPGALPVSAAEEIDRVAGVIEALRREFDIPVSVDTSKPAVMRAAAAAGASMINDVCALQSEGALDAAAGSGLPVCLMHMQGEPRTMQENPLYGDVTEDVIGFLLARATVSEAAGISPGMIILDPGFGFGKTLQHNLDLLRDLDRLVAVGYPVLAGLSRKSMIASILDDVACDRVAGSVTLALYAWRKGAHIVRVHDVGHTVQALQVEMAVDAAN